jgi:hypothetical protein
MLLVFSRLSFNQLKILDALLQTPSSPVSVTQIASKTNLKGKALGAVLSSLSRLKPSIIIPAGKARDGGGLRWQANDQVIDVSKAKISVNQLLKSYD